MGGYMCIGITLIIMLRAELSQTTTWLSNHIYLVLKIALSGFSTLRS